MKVEGTRTYGAPRAQIWEVLNDPAEMAALMPGVESFDVQDESHWRAKVKVSLGLGSLRMSIKFEQMESREPEHARLHAKGEGVGAIMSMDTQFDLSEGDGKTDMRWEADVRIFGQVASMGQRVIQPIVNQQVQQVLNALDKRVQTLGREGRMETVSESREKEPPAESTPEIEPSEVEGTSGAEEGIHPASPETYSDEPDAPTHSTES